VLHEQNEVKLSYQSKDYPKRRHGPVLPSIPANPRSCYDARDFFAFSLIRNSKVMPSIHVVRFFTPKARLRLKVVVSYQCHQFPPVLDIGNPTRSLNQLPRTGLIGTDYWDTSTRIGPSARQTRSLVMPRRTERLGIICTSARLKISKSTPNQQTELCSDL
jgi:hypothetical protein